MDAIIAAALPVTGLTPAAWTLPLLVFGGVSLVDMLLPRLAPRPGRRSTSVHDALLVTWLPLLILNILVCPSITALGLVCGQALVVAHELIHRRSSPVLLAVGRSLLGVLLYPHFEHQHLAIHHPYSGQPERDPATAPKGMSLWSFLWRSIRDGHRPSWRDMLTIVSVLMVSLACGRFWTHLAGAGLGMLLLETTNYIEHYGCRTWDSTHMLSSLILFRLTHHADHHLRPATHFLELTIRRSSAKLRYPYPLMYLVAAAGLMDVICIEEPARSVASDGTIEPRRASCH
jgi:hypothetical protein